MKKRFAHLMIFLLFTFLLDSCSENPKSIKHVIESQFKEASNDPKSYESIDIKPIDTLMITELLEIYIDNERYFAPDLGFSSDEDMVKFYQKMYDEYRREEYRVALDNYKAKVNEKIKRKEEIKVKIQTYKDSIEVLAKNNLDKIKYIKCYHKFRAKNALGALVLNEYIIYLNDTLGIEAYHSVMEDKEKRLY